MASINKIFMKLEETQFAKADLDKELEHLQNGINARVGDHILNHDWWLSESANNFWDSLAAWKKDCEAYKNNLQAYLNRIDRERNEWMEYDLLYKYSKEALEDKLVTPTAETEFWTSAGNKWSMDPTVKIPFPYLFSLIFPGALLPASMRYPETTTVTTFRGLFGWVWEQETPRFHIDADAGIYAGGLYADFEAGRSDWYTSYNGIPLAFSLHGPSAGGKAGWRGDAFAAFGGLDLGVPGLATLGLDAGWGWGADNEKVRLGPISISADIPELFDVIFGGKTYNDPGPSLDDSW